MAHVCVLIPLFPGQPSPCAFQIQPQSEKALSLNIKFIDDFTVLTLIGSHDLFNIKTGSFKYATTFPFFKYLLFFVKY